MLSAPTLLISSNFLTPLRSTNTFLHKWYITIFARIDCILGCLGTWPPFLTFSPCVSFKSLFWICFVEPIWKDKENFLEGNMEWKGECLGVDGIFATLKFVSDNRPTFSIWWYLIILHKYQKVLTESATNILNLYRCPISI